MVEANLSAERRAPPTEPELTGPAEGSGVTYEEMRRDDVVDRVRLSILASTCVADSGGR